MSFSKSKIIKKVDISIFIKKYILWLKVKQLVSQEKSHLEKKVVEERLESLLDPRIKNQRNIEVRVESNSTN